MRTFFVLGMIGEDGKSHFDLDDIRKSYDDWDKQTIEKGFKFDFEDEGGFHYRHPGKKWTVWIRKLFVPA